MTERDFVIVGAGVSGCFSFYRLAQEWIRGNMALTEGLIQVGLMSSGCYKPPPTVHLCDESGRLGGRLRSLTIPGNQPPSPPFKAEGCAVRYYSTQVVIDQVVKSLSEDPSTAEDVKLSVIAANRSPVVTPMSPVVDDALLASFPPGQEINSRIGVPAAVAIATRNYELFNEWEREMGYIGLFEKASLKFYYDEPALSGQEEFRLANGMDRLCHALIKAGLQIFAQWNLWLEAAYDCGQMSKRALKRMKIGCNHITIDLCSGVCSVGVLEKTRCLDIDCKPVLRQRLGCDLGWQYEDDARGGGKCKKNDRSESISLPRYAVAFSSCKGSIIADQVIFTGNKYQYDGLVVQNTGSMACLETGDKVCNNTLTNNTWFSHKRNLRAVIEPLDRRIIDDDCSEDGSDSCSESSCSSSSAYSRESSRRFDRNAVCTDLLQRRLMIEEFYGECPALKIYLTFQQPWWDPNIFSKFCDDALLTQMIYYSPNCIVFYVTNATALTLKNMFELDLSGSVDPSAYFDKWLPVSIAPTVISYIKEHIPLIIPRAATPQVMPTPAQIEGASEMMVHFADVVLSVQRPKPLEAGIDGREYIRSGMFPVNSSALTFDNALGSSPGWWDMSGDRAESGSGWIDCAMQNINDHIPLMVEMTSNKPQRKSRK